LLFVRPQAPEDAIGAPSRGPRGGLESDFSWACQYMRLARCLWRSARVLLLFYVQNIATTREVRKFILGARKYRMLAQYLQQSGKGVSA